MDGQCLRFVGRRVAGHPLPSGRGLIAPDRCGGTVSGSPDEPGLVAEDAPSPDGVAACLHGLEAAGPEELFPEGSDEAFGDAGAPGEADERRRRVPCFYEEAARRILTPPPIGRAARRGTP